MQAMRTMRRQQAGLSMISWMLVIVIAGFFVMMGLRLFPVYMEHFNVVSSLNSLKTDSEAIGKGPGELRDHLLKRLDINDVSAVHSDDITIERNGDQNVVHVTYDVDVPFMGNLDFLVHFDNKVEVPAH